MRAPRAARAREQPVGERALAGAVEALDHDQSSHGADTVSPRRYRCRRRCAMSAEPIDFGPCRPLRPEGWTVADVDALPDRDGVRYELVDGVPHVMTPPRGRAPGRAARELHLALRATAPPDCGSSQGVGVVLAEDQRPIPDVVVLRHGGLDTELSNFPADWSCSPPRSSPPRRARRPLPQARPLRPGRHPLLPAGGAGPAARRRLPPRRRRRSTRRPAAPRPARS